jgi:dUTP pyrophosphatase
MTDPAVGTGVAEVLVTALPHGEGLPLPTYATSGSSGADVVAAVGGELKLEPGGRCAVPTGLVVAIPEGFELQVRPRSGLALHHGVTVANAPGTIDADYRGEVMVILVNLGSEPYVVRRGDRIAQLVLAPVARGSFARVTGVPPTERGAGGFGSTGA